jgi:molecular chaperone DnaJ
VNVDDLGDIFSSVFGGGFGGGAPRRETRGDDLHVEIRISLEEAFSGGTHSFRIPAQVTCATCDGAGTAEGAKLGTCKNCQGKGHVIQMRRTILGQFQQAVTCSDCEGTGKVPEKACKDCGGTGRKKGQRDVTVEIEPGIGDGQTVVVPHMGDAGRRGLPTGSLGVMVRVARHNVFTREGDDLFVEQKVSPLELLAHEPIQVRSIEGGTIPVEIGAHVDLATPFRVKGEGMPRFRSRGRGDLYVQFHVVTGKKPGKKEKEIIEQLFES